MSYLVRRADDTASLPSRYRPASPWRGRLRETAEWVGVGLGGILVSVFADVSVVWPWTIGYGVWLVLGFRRLWRLLEMIDRKCQDGSRLAALGELDEAARIYESVCDDAKQHRKRHATAVGSLGAIALKRGEFDDAGALLESAIRNGRLRAGGTFQEVFHAFATHLATLHALRNDLGPAWEWLRKARSSTTELGARELTVIEALLSCRAGQLEDALELLDKEWPRMEELLHHRQRLLAFIIALFCMRQLGGDKYRQTLGHLRPDAMREELLSGSLASFQYLGTEWPEMREFLASDLST